MNNKKMTAEASSVGADERQPNPKNIISIITNSEEKCNLQATNVLRTGGGNVLATKTLTEIYDTVYPKKKTIIEGLLYSGIYIFVGAPKVGKSFFMAQLGYHISSGIPLWNKGVLRGQVLYLALEDDYPRLQQRLSTMFGTEENDKFHLAVKSNSLEDGLEEQLETFMAEHDQVQLIIIDTLQKIRETGADKYSYAQDYSIIGRLKSFCEKYDVCLIVVHHTRKMDATDSFEMISGTNGLLGAADGAMVMQKEKRTDNKAELSLVGRDQQDMRLHLEFDRQKLQWNLIEMETELWVQPPDPVLDAVSKVVTEKMPYWRGSATDLLELLPEVDMIPNVLSRRLNVNAGRLYEEYGIKYTTERKRDARYIELYLEAQV